MLFAENPAAASCVEELALAEQLSWFETNKAGPTRFWHHIIPVPSREQETAISWVKASADGHVRRLRPLVALVEEAGRIRINELRTKRPGYIVFEDDHQVVALPFADTPR
ncbi:hypothetical protein [Mesorhizobium sp.]|uniref:hypothetical protein n=1 Tax=Mesorhizobium sp. TaxID=1871066 RepID=UPI000FE4625A|nr:hypothetical protein [Mesorhizobium sp.]RWP55086.1 MAG: hypothetical protein EOR08_34235 [Mesorhizobium sp.]